MSELRVDFGVLSDLASSVLRRIDDVEELLSEVDGQVNTLAELWQGAAGEGFQRTIARWRATVEDLRDRLAFAHECVTTAHTNHAGAVIANTAMWRV